LNIKIRTNKINANVCFTLEYRAMQVIEKLEDIVNSDFEVSLR